MSALDDALRTVSSSLTEDECQWALVGALAVSARTEPRFTRDIDIAVSVANDPDAEFVVRRLVERGYSVFSVVEQEAMGRLATARLVGRTLENEAPVIVDLLFASSGIERDLVLASERLEVLPGIHIPVARAGHLLALKMLSRDDRRPQDAADIQALLRELEPAERARALDAVCLIASRGFARGKNLEAELLALPGFAL